MTASIKVVNVGTKLLNAVRGGNVINIMRLLNTLNPNDLNPTTELGVTPLWIASLRGYTNIVKELLKRGADVNKADDNGKTPLFMASLEGHAKVVEVLLGAKGIKVDKAEKDYGYTPLMIASSEGHTKVVEMLLGAKGIKINKMDKFKRTSLWIASKRGHMGVVKLLLTTPGIKINQVDVNMITPLYAAKNNNIRRLLLNSGANSSISNMTVQSIGTPVSSSRNFSSR